MNSETSLPFFVRGLRVGRVDNVTRRGGFSRGHLTFDDCADRSLFEYAVSLALEVDSCPPESYQEHWARWRRLCDELQDLQLWIGNGPTPVEEFSLESDWSIEWSDMDSEFVGH